jgi:RNA polymerase sigma factor (sigma-70 family)
MRDPDYLFLGAFLPVLSLDTLLSQGNDEPFDIVDDVPPIESGLEQLQALKAVDDFLATLSVREQDVVKRIYWEGQTQTEVAKAYGVTRMAICKTVARICRLGREALAAYEPLATFH